MSIYLRKKIGRCANGAHRDGGVKVHAVLTDRFPSWQKAVCGTEPGNKGNGWGEAQDPKRYSLTCPACIRKLSAGGQA